MVHTLIDIAEVVVVDTRRASPAVVQETLRMLNPKRAGKAIFVCDSDYFYGAAYTAASALATEGSENEVVGLDQIRFTSPDEVAPLLQVAFRGGWGQRLPLLKAFGKRSWREFLYELRWVIVLVSFLSALSGFLLLVAGPLL